jgi:hypothetical protein
VLAAEHLLDFARLHFLVERLDGLCKLGVNGLTRGRPLEEHAEIVCPLPEGRRQFAVLLEAAASLEHALRLGLVLPEVGRGGARLETIQFFSRVSGLKDSSTDRQRVC